MKLDEKIFSNALWGEKTEITDKIVKFYKENPQELDLIIDKEFFYGKFIRFFFMIGIVLTVVSRLLKFLFEDTWAAFVNEVVLDIFSELGIAIFGGAITAFLLKTLKQKQYKENTAFRKEILRRINSCNC
ncbi:hypothetical protein [Chryseobacterium sp.]|uniref:hypothetical protein n=1 Tax=Chryseobacterium sp. TaxID=1871047 RepID=UPI002FC7881B